jgi:hypothetical protein
MSLSLQAVDLKKFASIILYPSLPEQRMFDPINPYLRTFNVVDGNPGAMQVSPEFLIRWGVTETFV